MEALSRIPDEPTAADVRHHAGPFLAECASSASFAGMGSDDAKARVVRALLAAAQSTASADPQAAQIALSALRILCRERAGLDDLQSKRGLAALASLADLTPAPSPPLPVSVAVIHEALKVLINATHSQPRPQALLWDGDDGRDDSGVGGIDALPWLVDRIRGAADADEAFLLARLLFLAAMPGSPARIARLAGPLDAASAVFAMSERFFTSFSPSSSSPPGAFSESLRCLFALCARGDVAVRAAWMPLLFAALALRGDGAADARLQAAHVLFHAPLPLLAAEARRADAAARGVENALAMLDAATQHSDPSQVAEEALPLLLFLTRMALADAPARRAMAAAVLPARRGAVRAEEADGVGGRLARLITTPMLPLKHSVEDFIFVLCKQSAALYIRRVGYGNAASLLHGRPLEAPRTAPLEPFSDDDDDDDGARGGDVSASSAGADMTEEEKEMEAERLADLFRRLEATGVVRIMTADGEQQPPPS